MSTVAILAQGTSLADALKQAFFFMALHINVASISIILWTFACQWIWLGIQSILVCWNFAHPCVKSARQLQPTCHYRGHCKNYSELLSQHCRERLLLLALLPACVDAQIINCQGVASCDATSLQTICLHGAAHPCSLQCMEGALHTSTLLCEQMPMAVELPG